MVRSYHPTNEKAPSLLGAFFLIGQRPTLPHTRACSTIGAEGLNFRVRDGNGWNPLATITQNLFGNGNQVPFPKNIDGRYHKLLDAFYSVFTVKFYGQAERAISNGQLSILLHLHIRPINVVVYH